MAPNEIHSGVRHQVLNMLMHGTHDLEKIKERLSRTRGWIDEGDATAAGRSQLDAMVWKIMSSLCNAGLVESTRVRQFRITEDGEEVLRNNTDSRISTDDLKIKSADYRRLASGPDLAVTAPQPQEVPVQHKTGIVSLIDMLGTKDSRNKECNVRVHSSWNALLSYAEHLVRNEPALQSWKVSAFSDTMFITAEGDAKVLLGAFGRMSARLIPKSIDLDIPIRGCVAAGEFYQSGRKLFTGMAVTEAASYYERPQWIGISSCPSAYNVIDGLGNGRAYYTKYDMPLKQSVEFGALVVNWPDHYNQEHADREKELDKMLNTLDSRLGRTDGIDASLKWRNTRDFLCVSTGTERRPIVTHDAFPPSPRGTAPRCRRLLL